MGTYRKNLSGNMAYSSFVPEPLSEIRVLHTNTLQRLIAEVESAMQELNERVWRFSDDKLQQLIKQEAEYSCGLALGEQTLSFGFLKFGDEDDRLKEDTDNLLKATLCAFRVKDELPLSGRLLKQCHYLLCQSEHYAKKYPGEFRTSPVWIGWNGSSLQNALFIPPVYEDMIKAISNLEHYIHYEEQENVFVRAALIHYQFEMIHPFIDGNGRIGRLLNLLFLAEKKVLSQPLLPLSYLLSRNAIRYYRQIQQVNETGAYEDWVHFFLTMLRDSARYCV